MNAADGIRLIRNAGVCVFEVAKLAGLARLKSEAVRGTDRVNLQTGGGDSTRLVACGAAIETAAESAEHPITTKRPRAKGNFG